MCRASRDHAWKESITRAVEDVGGLDKGVGSGEKWNRKSLAGFLLGLEGGGVRFLLSDVSFH